MIQSLRFGLPCFCGFFYRVVCFLMTETRLCLDQEKLLSGSVHVRHTAGFYLAPNPNLFNPFHKTNSKHEVAKIDKLQQLKHK